MSYSLKTLLKKKGQELTDKMHKENEIRLLKLKAEGKAIWDKCINETYEELYDEATNMYDKLIEDFYKYKTKSYYRHHVGIGTGTGENLYFGKQFELQRGTIPSLHLDFSGKDMDGYRTVTTDDVLANVMNGIRGVPEKGWWTTWHGSYDGKYFSVGGTDITTAFNIFEDNLEHIKRYIFYEKVNREKSSGKYKFYKL